MDGLHSNTNISSVCLYQALDFREDLAVYSILFYSTLSVALSFSLSLSLIRSLLFIDPSMTSEERGGERDVEREGFAAEKFSFLVIFGVFLLLLLLYMYV